MQHGLHDCAVNHHLRRSLVVMEANSRGLIGTIPAAWAEMASVARLDFGFTAVCGEAPACESMCA